MKKILVSMALLGSAFVGGCSSGGGSSGSDAITNCNSDSDCGSGNVCNTAGHVCMSTCTGTINCPANDTCAVVSLDTAGSAHTMQVCQCTSGNCGGGSTYCDSTTDFICEVSCSDNSGCMGFTDSARTCVNGQCIASAPDAGAGCFNPANACPSGQECSPTTFSCVEQDAGPGSCGTPNTLGNCTTAGQYCDGTNCVAPASCSAGGPAADANSPIVWGVSVTGTSNTDANCQDANGNMQPVTSFQAYYLNEGSGVVPVGTFNGSGNGSTTVWGNIGYVKASGSTIYLTYAAASITAGAPSAPNTFTFQICNYASGDGIHVGAVLMDGTAGGGTYNAPTYSQVVPMADVSAAACFP